MVFVVAQALQPPMEGVDMETRQFSSGLPVLDTIPAFEPLRPRLRGRLGKSQKTAEDRPATAVKQKEPAQGAYSTMCMKTVNRRICHAFVSTLS